MKSFLGTCIKEVCKKKQIKIIIGMIIEYAKISLEYTLHTRYKWGNHGVVGPIKEGYG